MPLSPTFADQTALVATDGLSVAFDGKAALHDVSVRLDRGDAIALIGPNGAGKTTLLRAVMGLVPTSGEVRVLGREPLRARREVAYVPQAENLEADFPISALEVVLMGRYRHVGWFRRPGRKDRTIAHEALERVGMGERAKVRFGALSGGQRQRVLLARAIAQQSPVLLLDEPFNGVDVVTSDVIVDVLQQLRNDGAGIVVSTHDFAMARRIASHVCLLHTVQMGFGPVDEVLTGDRLRQTFEGQLIEAGDGTTMIVPSHH